MSYSNVGGFGPDSRNYYKEILVRSVDSYQKRMDWLESESDIFTLSRSVLRNTYLTSAKINTCKKSISQKLI